MRVQDFDYHLPTELIAQRPLEQRDHSRMLVLQRSTGVLEDRLFRDLPQFLRGDELLVINNTRVLPARLFGHRAGVFSQTPSRKTKAKHLHGQVEIFLTRRMLGDTWEALVRPGRKLPVGERVIFGVGENEELEAEILTRGELGIRTVRFSSKNGLSVSENIQRLGHVPLPPYIDRADEDSDRERYQTVFAQKPGAVAAPTAGLHFTREILEKIRARGCEICDVTLEVGLGTFQPIHSETLEEHKIHTEAYEISETAVAKINTAKKEGKPIFAVGTTVVRALEDSARRAVEFGSENKVIPGPAEACIFIKPGYTFRIVDMLLTNFHLPKSTLLALVSSLAGRETILAAYRHAVEKQYRFYSYGDCMLIR
jgi:S-adenosylmethionine:tRNA ribosyltransferase-isomerase